MKDKLAEATPMAPHKYPPTLSLSEEDLPDIKDWRVGQTYKMVIEVKQVSSSMGDTMMGEGKKKMNARFEVMSAKAIDGKASTEDFQVFEHTYSKDEE